MVRDLFINLKRNKGLMYSTVLSILVLLCIALNVTFSAFTQSTNNRAANIRVGTLTYKTIINGNETFIIEAPANMVTKENVLLLNLNEMDTNYELTYNVCDSASCDNEVSTVEGVKVEYSTLTKDGITGQININGNKSIRLVITNDTETKYYIKLGINAGFAHNALTLDRDITEKYPEDDAYIAAYINGELSDSFPTSRGYLPSVSCVVGNGNISNAIGTVKWENGKWVLNVLNIDTGLTRCNINFNPIGASSLISKIFDDYEVSESLTTPGQKISDVNEAVLASATDDYGTSYYFRGNIQNNYVLFAGKCWKIVRIDGNGNIKLFLWNDANSCTSTSDAVVNEGDGTSAFNDKEWTGLKNIVNGVEVADALGRSDVYTSNRPAGIGFMYGDVMGTTYSAVHANTNDSDILSYLKTWYNQTFTSDTLKGKLADVIWCGDKSIASYSAGTGVEFGTDTYFSARGRLYAEDVEENMNPSLICPNDASGGNLSRYTAASSENDNNNAKGNGALNGYKIGLLTADEVAFAGARYNTVNANYYLNTGGFYWTMSPAHFSASNHLSRVWRVDSTGYLYGSYVANGYGVRPAVSLISTVEVLGGEGTSSDPYIIKET